MQSANHKKTIEAVLPAMRRIGPLLQGESSGPIGKSENIGKRQIVPRLADAAPVTSGASRSHARTPWRPGPRQSHETHVADPEAEDEVETNDEAETKAEPELRLRLRRRLILRSIPRVRLGLRFRLRVWRKLS